MKKMTFVIAILLSFIFFLLVHQVFILGNTTIDDFFMDHVVLGGRSASLTEWWKFITSFSSVLVLFLITLLFLTFSPNKKEKIFFLGNIGGVVLISQLLKFFFQRSRPLILYRLVEESGYSFPSGHAMVSAAFYGYLIYCLWKSDISKVGKRIGSVLLTCLIIGIGFSRIYLGVHYATDVLAGFCLGTLFVISYIYWKENGFKMERKKLSNSFRYAGEGIISAFLSERNMKIHVTIMFLVIFCGFYFQISVSEWMTCLVLFGLVIAFEIMNTALETVVDIAMPEQNPKAKLAKDLAAGAVLVAAIVAAIIGLMIFFPKIGL